MALLLQALDRTPTPGLLLAQAQLAILVAAYLVVTHQPVDLDQEEVRLTCGLKPYLRPSQPSCLAPSLFDSNV